MIEAEMQKCVCGADVRWGLCDACEWKSSECELPKTKNQVNIDELKRLDREATQGPWYVSYGGVSESDEGFGIASRLPGMGTVAECWPCSTDLDHRRRMLADSKMIPYLRNNTQAIISEIETLRARVKELEQAKEACEADRATETPIDNSTL